VEGPGRVPGVTCKEVKMELLFAGLRKELWDAFERRYRREPSAQEAKYLLDLVKEKHDEIEEKLVEIMCLKDNGNQGS
jgi:uncharacterized protein YeaO (DUF488 family)